MTDVWSVLGTAALVLVVAGVVVAFVHLSRNSHPKSGHYDPDAIGHYTFDPAIPRWKFHLPPIQRGRSVRRGRGQPDRHPPEPPSE